MRTLKRSNPTAECVTSFRELPIFTKKESLVGAWCVVYSISINMLVKIRLDGGTSLVDIARFCGCAPCQIVAVNGVRTEKDLVVGQDILVPVVTMCLIKK